MAENINLGFLGKEFQNKFVWQLLTDNQFGEKIIYDLDSSYMDDNYLKRIVILYKDYYNDYEKVPSILNNSIVELINGKITDPIEKETLLTIIRKIKNYNKNIKLGKVPFDGDVVQKQVWTFIRQQKYIKLSKKILTKTSEGDLNIINDIESDLQDISKTGRELDFGQNILDNLDETLGSQFRDPIATQIPGLDAVMGGGLGRGEMGFILAPLGCGKTSILTVIANNAFRQGKNVIQIFLEDTYPQIKRKHICCFSGYGLNDYDNNKETIREIATTTYNEIHEKYSNRLTLLKLPQEDFVTIPYIKKYIQDLEKIYGIKYDMVVLDYIDCIESHIQYKNDSLMNELVVIKAFEAMLADFNIAGWSAFQGNRSSIGSETVNTGQLGGNIKKAQKTHFLMSLARTDQQKEQKLANIKILKSRFGVDGILFENSFFDNEYLNIGLNASNTNSIDLVLSSIDNTTNYETNIQEDTSIEDKVREMFSHL